MVGWDDDDDDEGGGGGGGWERRARRGAGSFGGASVFALEAGNKRWSEMGLSVLYFAKTWARMLASLRMAPAKTSFCVSWRGWEGCSSAIRDLRQATLNSIGVSM